MRPRNMRETNTKTCGSVKVSDPGWYLVNTFRLPVGKSSGALRAYSTMNLKIWYLSSLMPTSKAES